MNGTTAVVGYTNLNSDVLGAANAVKILQVANTNSANLTNCSIQLLKKTVKAAP